MIGFSFSELIIVIPELYLISVALIILLVSTFTAKSTNGSSAIFARMYNISILTLVLTIILMISIRFVSFRAFNNMVTSSFIVSVFKVTLLILSFIIMVFSRNFLIERNSKSFEYIVIFLFTVLGMVLIIMASDLLSLYISLEIQAISLYILIASNKKDKFSNEASIKYFIMSALGTALFLFGSSFIYGATGHTGFIEIKSILGSGFYNKELLTIGLLFLIASLAFKLSLAPFHMWVPDVYQGTLSPIVSLIAAPAKVAFVFLIVNFLLFVFKDVFTSFSVVIQALGVISILVGSLVAIAQRNIKRIVAYSSVASIGYVALLLGSVKDSIFIDTIYIYTIIYTLTTILFLSLTMNIKRNDKYIENIDDLKGLANKKPFISISIAVIMISFVGIPPLAGFFGKFFIFYRLVEVNQIGLAVFAVIMSVVASFYYLRIIKIVYFDEDKEANFTTSFSRYVSFVYYALVALLLGFIFFIHPFTNYISGYLY